MSGELNAYPDLQRQITELRAQIYGLTQRLNDAQQHLRLGDLDDVRTDGLADVSVTRPVGAALVWTADDLWKPGTSAAGFPITFDDGTNTYIITANGNSANLLRVGIMRDSDSHFLGAIDIDPIGGKLYFNFDGEWDLTVGDWNGRINGQWDMPVTGDINLSAGGEFNLSSDTDCTIVSRHGFAGFLAQDVTQQTAIGQGGATDGGLILGNHVNFVEESSASGPVGTIVGKIPVYDGATPPTLLGYMPVYDAIP